MLCSFLQCDKTKIESAEKRIIKKRVVAVDACTEGKIMSEALHRLRFQAFLDSVSDEESASVFSVVSDLLNNFPSDNFQEKLAAEPFSEILDKYEDFVAKESECNPTFSLWSTYLEMIGILLQFVR